MYKYLYGPVSNQCYFILYHFISALADLPTPFYLLFCTPFFLANVILDLFYSCVIQMNVIDNKSLINYYQPVLMVFVVVM